jgi:hypothetical protein
MDKVVTDAALPAAADGPDPATSFRVDLEAQASPSPRTPSAQSAGALDASARGPFRVGLSESSEKLGMDPQAECELTLPGIGGQAILQHVTSSSKEQEVLLALPPPPSYDVVVDKLSIAVPPFRAYIPTPIPIPIPQAITDTIRRWTSKSSGETNVQADATDGLIVRNVSAVVRRGEVMAIIGGSGSGKTTLLHAMAARLGNLPIAEGHVSITPSSNGTGPNGAQPKGGKGHFRGMSKVVGFVRQHDYLLPHLTGSPLSTFIITHELTLEQSERH